MDLDDIREILYAYTKELATFVDERGDSALYEEEEVESFVEEFLTSNEDLLGEAAVVSAEESY